jgi:hypothetical protein
MILSLQITRPENDRLIFSFSYREMGWDWGRLVRRPQTRLLHQSWMVDEYEAFGGMRTGRGNLSTFEEHPPQQHFVHQKSHMTSRIQTAAITIRQLTA